ncbi:hypothetical protein CKM354_000106300 [Cercospora kikuchii]|uniref:Uncharacterized protein n=1 Tax=Cercospora kikuchii TaxID=84275 RepID=A0A9P3FCK6_9PEZI|nr:uncharacterized protein CKM354_000106300 [Cercospora kikuchii]GIZ37620.1 hypothetical protein CKM354_000106300 [Cercospora kikuchii]
MASIPEPDRTESYVPSVHPIDLPPAQSTTTPATPDSTASSPPLDLRKKQSRPRPSRPPTEGGGPLSSHPTSEYKPGAWPPTPDPDMHNKTSTDTSGNTRSRNDSFTSPASPAATSTHMYSTHEPPHQRPGTVRRMFSLSSLRQSFSSSRTSFSQRPDTSHGSYHAPYLTRAESPNDAVSTTASTAPPASMRLSNERRPATSSRKKRSSSWFKRKSHLFGMNDDGTLDVLDEDGPEHKRFKDNQLPTLPEIGALSGGKLDGGSIGWDDKFFTRN